MSLTYAKLPSMVNKSYKKIAFSSVCFVEKKNWNYMAELLVVYSS